MANNLFQQNIEAAKQFQAELRKIAESFKKIKAATLEMGTSGAKAQSEILIKKQELIKLQKQEITLKKKITTANEKKLKTIKEETGIVGGLIKKQKELRNAQKATQDPTKLKKLNKELYKTNTALKQAKNTTGTWGKALGSFAFKFNFLGNLMSSVALKFVSSLREIPRMIKDYEKQLATLGGISKATSTELAAMDENAKKLGETTQWTATQVAALQTEFARLGFATDEIIAMSEATLNAATAMDAELAPAALLVGSVIKAFDKDATDAANITDILTASTQNSALSFEKLSVALPIVGTTAKFAGVSLEKMTAQLGTITDRGVDASTAATGLRNIYLELSKQGLTFEEAMLKIQNSTTKNATAMELFGKRSATTALILSESGASVDELTQKLYNSGDAAKDLAEDKLNTLDGSLKLLQSAWQGYILRMNDATGAGNALTKLLKFLADNLETILNLVVKVGSALVIYKTVDKLTKSFRGLQKGMRDAAASGKGLLKSMSPNAIALIATAIFMLGREVIKMVKEWRKGSETLQSYNRIAMETTKNMAAQKVGLDLLFNSLNNTKEGSQEYKEIIGQINTKYGEYLPNLIKEEALLVDVAKAYSMIVIEMRKKIAAAAAEDELIELAKRKAALERELEEMIERAERTGFGDVKFAFKKEELEEVTTAIEKIYSNLEAAHIQSNANREAADKNLTQRQKALIERYNQDLKENLSLTVSNHDIAHAYYTDLMNLIAKYNKETGKNLTNTVANYEIAKQYYGLTEIGTVTMTKSTDAYTQLTQEISKYNQKLLLSIMANDGNAEAIANQLFQLEKQQTEVKETAEYWKEYYKQIQKVKEILSEEPTRAEQESNNPTDGEVDDTISGVEALASNLDEYEAMINKWKLDSVTGGGEGFLNTLLGMTDEELKSFVSDIDNALQQVGDAFSQFYDLRINKIAELLNANDAEISSLQNQVDKEKELMQAGNANEYNEYLKKLQNEEKLRAINLERLKKAQKQQQAIEFASQAVSMGTSVANTIESYSEIPIVGWILGIAAAASLVAGFFAQRKAIEAGTKAEKGYVGTLDGERHSSGGVNLGESGVEAERGEIMGIFSRGASSKYNTEIYDFVNAANQGQLEAFMNTYNSSVPSFNTTIAASSNDRYLKELVKQNEKTNRYLKTHKNIFPDGSYEDVHGNKTIKAN